MPIGINGKSYTEEQLLCALQKHFGVGDLHGNLTHIIRECYKWQVDKKGVPYHWKMIERDYNNYMETGELPECTWYYYAEVVDSARNALAKEAQQ